MSGKQDSFVNSSSKTAGHYKSGFSGVSVSAKFPQFQNLQNDKSTYQRRSHAVSWFA